MKQKGSSDVKGSMASWSTFIFKSVTYTKLFKSLRSIRFIYWEKKFYIKQGCNELIKSDSKDFYVVKNILQIHLEISFNVVIMRIMIMRNEHQVTF